MPDPVTAIIGGVSTVAGGAMQSRAAKKAGASQERAAEMGIEEQRAARLATEKLMAPYVAAGTGSLEQQQAILGLLGPEAQQQAYSSIEQGPLFQSLVKQGEEGILQTASATGGLRGGNIQAALGQFRPQMLQNMIQSQYQNLAGLTSLGQASAAGQAGFGQSTASNIGNLYGQIGQAQAGAALGQGQAWGNVLNAPMQLAGMASGAGMGVPQFLGF